MLLSVDSQKVKDLLLKLADRFAEVSDLCRQLASNLCMAEQVQHSVEPKENREKRSVQPKSFVKQIQQIESEIEQEERSEDQPQIPNPKSDGQERQDANVQTLLDYVLNIRKYIRQCEEEYQNLRK